MAITFKYKKIERPEPFPAIYAPAIPISLIGPKESIDVIGLLDSGADFTAIPYEMAEILGLDLSNKPEEIGGVGGKTKAILTKMRIILRKKHDMHPILVKVYAVKTTIEDEIPVLIGRQGFFERFKITFNEKDRKIKLKKN